MIGRRETNDLETARARAFSAEERARKAESEARSIRACATLLLSVIIVLSAALCCTMGIWDFLIRLARSAF